MAAVELLGNSVQTDVVSLKHGLAKLSASNKEARFGFWMLLGHAELNADWFRVLDALLG
jgi:hypothetical protein